MIRVTLKSRALIANASGSVLPLAAAGFLVMAALVGGGVDMSRAYRVENRLQAACDSGVLAGRRAVGTSGFDTQANDAANSYFAANFDEDRQGVSGTTFNAISDDDGNSVVGTATTEMPTVVMQVFGFDQINLSVECTAAMGVGNADVMMVLDTTGSMAWNAAGGTPSGGETSRLQDLQAAVRNFYDTVAASSEGSNSRIRYGFAPYSSSVNVGELIADVDTRYLVDSYAIQSRRWVKWGAAASTTSTPIYGPVTQDSNWTRTGSAYTTQSACLAVLPSTTAWTDDGSPSTSSSTSINSSMQKVTVTETDQDETRYVYSCILRTSNNRWYVNRRSQYRTKTSQTTSVQNATFPTSTAQPYDELIFGRFVYDVSSYKGFNAVSTMTGRSSGAPAMVSSTWAGCIEERQTVSSEDFDYVTGQGITPSEALDLDIDSAPDIDDDATKWAPMWPELAYYRSAGLTFATSGTKANSYCPVVASLFAEMDEDEFDDYVASLTASGSTYHDIGLLWGARLSSPQGIWQDLVNDQPDNGGSVSRHLIFMTDGELAPTTTVQSSYGIERHDSRVTGDGGTDQDARHRSRFLAICAAIRGKGIRLWVIAFGTGLSDDLQTCASPDSAFGAEDASELDAAFQEIARNVGELRVIQ